MGKLNFCKTCGSLQLEEAKDQLEKLLEKKLLPTRCGLCDVVISDIRTRGSKRKQPEIKIKDEPETEDEPKSGKKDAKKKSSSKGKKKSSSKGKKKVKLSSLVADSDETGTLDLSVQSDIEMVDVPLHDTVDNIADKEDVNSNDDEDDADADNYEPYDDDDDFEPQVDGENITENKKRRTKKEIEKEGFMDKSILGADILALMCDTDEQDKIVKLQCKLCNDSFISMFNMFRHVKSKHKVKVNETPYQCSACQMRFRRAKGLRTHMDKEHRAIQKCTICNKTSRRRNFLEIHMKTHEKKEPRAKIPCPELYCTVQLCSEKDLRRHMMIHTGEKPHMCETCGKAFIRKPDLTAHMRIHTGDYLHCTLCDDYRTNRKSTLNKHMRDFHSDKSKEVKKQDKETFICDICGGSYASKGSLKKHRIATHTKEKLYHCSQCDYVTCHSTNLIPHVKAVHEKLRPYKCSHCEKSFALPRTRQMHERTHTGETPYECEICKKRFRRRDGYNYHKKLHVADYQHECDVCGYRTIGKQGLILHKRKHHSDAGQPYKCTKCNMAFASPQALRHHNRGHKAGAEYIPKKTHQCQDCDFSTDQMRCLKKHLKTCHLGDFADATYECGYCHKKFKTASSCEHHVERFHMKYFKPLQVEETVKDEGGASSALKVADTSLKLHTSTVSYSTSSNFTADDISAVLAPLVAQEGDVTAVVTTSSAGPVHTYKTEILPAREQDILAAAVAASSTEPVPTSITPVHDQEVVSASVTASSTSQVHTDKTEMISAHEQEVLAAAMATSPQNQFLLQSFLCANKMLLPRQLC